jgi:RNase P/RNase MRP subunit p29
MKLASSTTGKENPILRSQKLSNQATFKPKEVNMHKQTMRFSFLALLLAVAMVVVSIQVAAAADGDEVEIAGRVISIDENNSFQVETEEGKTYTVLFEEVYFDFSTIQVGDTVLIEGTYIGDDSISASLVKVEEQEDDGDLPGGYYCEQSDERHPFGQRLASSYEGVVYETLQKWFCSGFGWGQIMLALKTSEITGDDFEALLEMRGDGEGWGQIWQDLELIGQPEDAEPLNDEDGNGRPDFAGPPEWVGDGRPEQAGPPEWVGDGRPEDAGPPDDKGGDGYTEDVDLPGDEERNGRPEDAGPSALPQVPGGPPEGVGGGRP